MTATPPGDPLLEALRARLGEQYAIEGLLGQGGMGSVYRARDLTLDRPVAIKVIGGDVGANATLRERFLREARTVAKLRHPNIVAVYSAGDAGGILYFVMELVPGESLRDLLAREGKVDAARGERILHELALALDYAHANGIVHRDVKPENILLDRDTGRAMLTDFGVAHALEGDGRMTGTGMILGSPRYMSPEQATGERTLDGRSDLYALALVGHEMFTGRPVVDAGNVAGMLVKHLTETPMPLADAVPAVPEGVATAIDRALAKDREQRWASGREMAEVIGMAWTPRGGSSGAGVRADGPGPAASATLRVQLPREPRARRRALVVLGATALALVAAAGALWMRRDGAPRGVDPRRSYAVMPFEVQSSNRDVQWLRDGAVNMLTLALSQWRDLTVADYERTMVLVREAGLEEGRVDLDRAIAIARRAGAWTVVTGTITTTADSLRVDARLYDVASGRALQTETRSAALAADPRPLFDGLARYLLGVAGGSATDAVDLAAATTRSIAAYRAYVEGTRALFSWRVMEADSLFGLAVRADSTFALAHHKRSLALGWGDMGGTAYLESAQKALDLSDRLPPRERALVKGHFHLAVGLRRANEGQEGRADLREAQATYRGLIAADSGVAEAWYGLADALFHERFDVDSIAASVARQQEALHGFHRTLQLDSTFHLAYSHLIQMYQQFAAPNAELLLDGDSVLVLVDSAALRRVGGVAGVARLKAEAGSQGLALARAWARSDQNAVQPHTTLVVGYLGVGLVDSAMATVERALERPAFRGVRGELWANGYRLVADDPRAIPGLLDALRRATDADLRALPASDRILHFAQGLSAAAASGRGAEVDRVSAQWARLDPVMPIAGGSTAEMLRWMVPGLRAAQRGTLTADERAAMLQGLRQAAELPRATQLRVAAGPFAYIGYLVTRDTAFSALVRRIGMGAPRWPELDAAEALARGDTAAARAAAAAFTRADSVRTARLGMAGMRTVLRAEVIAALGDPAEAAAQYEALHPSRFVTALVDPGYAVFVRSFAARARLYEELGDRAKAIAAWEEFLRRWRDGDASTEPVRREAREALRRLQDSPRARQD